MPIDIYVRIRYNVIRQRNRKAKKAKSIQGFTEELDRLGTEYPIPPTAKDSRTRGEYYG